MTTHPQTISAGRMKHLMASLEDIKNDLGNQKAVLLMDYDGTLTPIVRTPDEAVLHSDMKNVLQTLKERPNFVLAIISGRSLEDVKSKVRIDGICYAGNHGMEIEYKETLYIHPEAKEKMHFVQEICIELQLLLGNTEGVILENKGLTASVHYRIANLNDVPKIKETVEKIIKPYVERGDIRMTHGKKVLEIRPNIEWDKGKAVLWVLDSIENKTVERHFTMFIGDDRTDEDAFKALKGKGHTVLVSSEEIDTNAEYVLLNVGEVKKFLNWLSNLNENN